MWMRTGGGGGRLADVDNIIIKSANVDKGGGGRVFPKNGVKKKFFFFFILKM